MLNMAFLCSNNFMKRIASGGDFKEASISGISGGTAVFFFFVLWCIYLWNLYNKRWGLGGIASFFSKRSGVHFWKMKIMMTSPLYRFVWTSWSLISESFDDQLTLRRHVGNYIRNTTNMEVEYGCVWKLLFFVWVHRVDATHNVHLLTQFPTKRPKNPNRRKGINDQCQKNML